MQKFFMTLFSILTLSLLSYGEDLRSLLKKYEEEADLSNKTKKESLGHVIVFTRKDLEIMQAYTLGDILRSFPLTNFLLNRFGIKSMGLPGTAPSIPIIYRLYIDDHEVSSIHTSSPFLIYDDYPLDNIDHVEIYCSLGAISVSNQPSQMIIKMYTKDPKRENITKGRLSLDTKKSFTVNFLKAEQLNENSSLLLMLNRSNMNYGSPTINNQKLDRDQKRTHLFIKYIYYNSLIEFSFSDVKRGILSGFSSDAAPDYGKIRSQDAYLAFSQKLLSDRSLKLFVSYDFNSRKYVEDNSYLDGGIDFTPAVIPSDTLIYYKESRKFHKYSLTLEKTFTTKRNKLLTGLFLKYHNQELDDLNLVYQSGYTDKKDLFHVKFYRNLSGYIEDSYSITDRNLIIGGIRYDIHKYSHLKNHEKINLRAGFVSFISKKLVLKGFISRFNIIPSMYNLELAKDNYLDDMDVNVLTLEMRYIRKNSILKFYYKRCNVEKRFTTDPVTGRLVNRQGTERFNVFSIRYIHNLNFYNKLEFNIWLTDNDIPQRFSPQEGGYLKLFTEYKRFQMYNELIYRGSYEPYGIKISERFDLNIAFSYRFPYDWYVKIKGENLLNRAEKVGYMNVYGEKGTIPVYDRKIILTVEKAF
ncbi:MAG TPA: hypothetical protein DEP48_03435 [Persephonella sp.]|uniref:Uncharacterized protein n=2 Tax=Persephonella marina TaxID=309805 RepID=C0QSK0_PERMH|nr:TonB-dependent receptor [Persephonella sp.]ACO03651.1 conserved hypothetical protein [Persephonella marina EX-H1]HCB69392.1 hypothetical protein [Persephonella sp.]